MTHPSTLPPGAWVVRVDTSQPMWSVDVFSSHISIDHVRFSARETTVVLGGLLHNRSELLQLLGRDARAASNDASLVLDRV